MGFGVVIAKFRWLFPAGALIPLSRGIVHAANIGLLFAVVGLLTVALSVQRYLAARRESPVYAIFAMNNKLADLKLPEGYNLNVFTIAMPFTTDKPAMRAVRQEG